MRRAALILALAATAAVAALVWPARPTCRFATDATVLGFTPDGERLVCLEKATALRLATHDARTGRVVITVTLAPPAGVDCDNVHNVALSPDGRRLAVGPRSPSNAGWAVYDGATGDRVTALVGVPAHAAGFVFSPCGRWLVSTSFWHRGNDDGRSVFDAVTGRAVLSLDRGCCQIVARGDAAAVLWAGSPPAVELRDLPGGRVRTRFPLPAGLHLQFPRVHDWHGDRLLLQSAPLEAAGGGVRYYEFDTAADPVGQGVERSDLAEPINDPAWQLCDDPGRYRVRRSGANAATASRTGG